MKLLLILWCHAMVCNILCNVFISSTCSPCLYVAFWLCPCPLGSAGLETKGVCNWLSAHRLQLFVQHLSTSYSGLPPPTHHPEGSHCMQPHHPPQCHLPGITVYHSISQYITVYHSISQYTTVYHSISQYTTVYYSIYSTSPLFLWRQVGIIFHILTGSCTQQNPTFWIKTGTNLIQICTQKHNQTFWQRVWYQTVKRICVSSIKTADLILSWCYCSTDSVPKIRP